MPCSRNGSRSGGGRIRVDERVVDDESPIIGANIAVDQAHVVGIVQTEQASMSDKCRKEYRNRIKHIYRWLMETYPDYFEVGTRVLTQDERDDPVFFAHTNDRDLRYAGINVFFIKAFLSTKKVKRVLTETDENGEMKTTQIYASASDISKYSDAIKWAALRANQVLPSSYHREMEAFINAYKKEHKTAKKEGRTDEQEADPITSALFRMICMWAVNEGNIFVWVFSLAMWNLMSRSISVDAIAFHQIKCGASDSIKFKFDETQADKTGEI